jgi:hypothetical protein
MSVFAHSHLFLGPSTATVVSGPHIQVLDAQYVYVMALHFPFTKQDLAEPARSCTQSQTMQARSCARPSTTRIHTS